ncbi:MAG: outer membrane beta-barrel protein [Bacteroidia bacterium]
MRLKILLIVFVLFGAKGFAQNDSLLKQHDQILKEHERTFANVLDSIRKIKIRVEHFSEDLALTGTRIVSNEERAVEAPKLTIGGYVSAYYAIYSDTADANNFQKFPTTAPQSNAFSLNLAQISAKYSSNSLRAITVLHFGDMPRSVWSPVYNYIQEANAGIRLLKKVWLDAGFFRTHIGLESIQPRENIASSVAVATFFEPYYMAGAKLSVHVSDKLALQLNAFNSFNGFIESNQKKALGFSCIYDVSSKLSITFNSLWNDDSPDTSKIKLGRLYNNLYMIYKSKRLTLGLEANYGFQQNTSLDPAVPQKTAQMFSALAEAKVMLVNKLYIYGRAEYFNDQDEMLTGPEMNQNKQLIGLTVGGATLGIEYKPLQNTYLRLEGRELETQGDNEEIFFYNGKSSSVRYELMCSLGVWF